MGKKLYRYRSFNTDIESGYSYIHNSMINIEKWKFEAFEGLVYPSFGIMTPHKHGIIYL